MSHLVSRIRHGRLSVPRRRCRTAVREIAVPTERRLRPIRQGRRSRTDCRKISARPFHWAPVNTQAVQRTQKLPPSVVYRPIVPYGSDVHFRPMIRSRAPAEVPGSIRDPGGPERRVIFQSQRNGRKANFPSQNSTLLPGPSSVGLDSDGRFTHCEGPNLEPAHIGKLAPSSF